MTKKITYFKNLDGWRFLSFLAVFFFHSFHTENEAVKSDSLYIFITKKLFTNGNLGVNFFFVLSGFLITYLLLVEKQNGKINIKYFYLRRILRIWPLFYFCVIFGFVIFPYIKEFGGLVSTETANPIMYILFINNFDFINAGLPDSSVLGVLWSIAVEEQFYLVWPLLISFTRTKNLGVVFGLIILGSVIFRILYDSPIMHEHHTFSCMGDLAIGGMGAWLFNSSTQVKKCITNIKVHWIFLIYVLAILIFFFRKEILIANDFIRPFDRIIVSCVFLFMILEQNFSNYSFYKMSNYKLISRLGKYTYGLYSLHFIGILTAIQFSNYIYVSNSIIQVIIIDTLIALIVSIFISWLSYKYLESPFLHLKNKFSIFTNK